ncbi:MAG: hypothetical protein M1840_005221 [Geoglossum simile]|nr:MAG: hypothetical protein M1840_005221 [Geoglossum simile]
MPPSARQVSPTLKAVEKARDTFIAASEDENVIGLTAQQLARRRESKNAAEKALTTIQRSYTRRVEAFLRRQAKVDPAEDREKPQKRIANALEHLVASVYTMVSTSSLPSVPLYQRPAQIKEPVPNLERILEKTR